MKNSKVLFFNGFYYNFCMFSVFFSNFFFIEIVIVAKTLHT